MTTEANSKQVVCDAIDYFGILHRGEVRYLEQDNSSFSNSKGRPGLMPEDIFWMNLLAGREMLKTDMRSVPCQVEEDG